MNESSPSVNSCVNDQVLPNLYPGKLIRFIMFEERFEQDIIRDHAAAGCPDL